jgi:hypothetical protein
VRGDRRQPNRPADSGGVVGKLPRCRGRSRPRTVPVRGRVACRAGSSGLLGSAIPRCRPPPGIAVLGADSITRPPRLFPSQAQPGQPSHAAAAGALDPGTLCFNAVCGGLPTSETWNPVPGHRRREMRRAGGSAAGTDGRPVLLRHQHRSTVTFRTSEAIARDTRCFVPLAASVWVKAARPRHRPPPVAPRGAALDVPAGCVHA